MVAASASRKSSRRLQGISSTAANASRISEVPTATPSERSSSVKETSWGAIAAGPRSMPRVPCASLKEPIRREPRPRAAPRPARRPDPDRSGV